MQVSIHIHPHTALALDEGPDGPVRIAGVVAHALRTLRRHGKRIAYAPVVVSGDLSCAMSVRSGFRGVVIEIDAPGTALPRRGLVIERAAPVGRRPR